MIIEELLAEGKTQEQVGELLGISFQRVSQIVNDSNTRNPYDCRVTIPKTEYEKIYSMSQNGKSKEALEEAIRGGS